MGHMAHAAPAALGVYKPRRPQASPLFRLVSDHLQRLQRLQTVNDERFAREYGPWRPVVGQVADKFLACGILEHGFARIRCDACAHEYLLAFSCKCRYFCPSCHAKRLAIWAQWLDTTLLAPVPHRQVVLAIPKRLRAYCLYRRRLLGEIARVAARTLTAAIRALTGERDLAVGIVACLQTHGSRVNWHPHLHLLVTDGGFRADGTFVSWPAHDSVRLTEAFRRAVLRLFVRLDLFDEDQAAGMLTWPHSGFHVHTAVWVPEDDRAFATRLARYCARNPVALERLTYDRAATIVTYRSDKSEGPTAGTETADPLEFLARVLVHIPDKGQVTTRYYGWYAIWLVRQPPPRHAPPGGARRQAEPAAADAPVPMLVVPKLAPTEATRRWATRRWAALLRQIYEVDPLVCPRCAGPMRIVACITQAAVIDQILAHLRTRTCAHAPPGLSRGRAARPRPARPPRPWLVARDDDRPRAPRPSTRPEG
ncbi:MAG: transposase, partial [Vicinamibacterales bacterium]|nr:transposase [Vicinamibacterales bacterium]